MNERGNFRTGQLVLVQSSHYLLLCGQFCGFISCQIFTVFFQRISNIQKLEQSGNSGKDCNTLLIFDNISSSSRSKVDSHIEANSSFGKICIQRRREGERVHVRFVDQSDTSMSEFAKKPEDLNALLLEISEQCERLRLEEDEDSQLSAANLILKGMNVKKSKARVIGRLFEVEGIPIFFHILNKEEKVQVCAVHMLLELQLIAIRIPNYFLFFNSCNVNAYRLLDK